MATLSENWLNPDITIRMQISRTHHLIQETISKIRSFQPTTFYEPTDSVEVMLVPISGVCQIFRIGNFGAVSTKYRQDNGFKTYKIVISASRSNRKYITSVRLVHFQFYHLSYFGLKPDVSWQLKGTVAFFWCTTALQ